MSQTSKLQQPTKQGTGQRMAPVARAGDTFPANCSIRHQTSSHLGRGLWRYGRRVVRCRGISAHAAPTLYLYDSRNAAIGRVDQLSRVSTVLPSNVEPPWSGAPAPWAACCATHELVVRSSCRLTSPRFTEHRPWARPFRGCVVFGSANCLAPQLQGSVVGGRRRLCAVLPAAVGSGSHSREATSLGFTTRGPSARPFRGLVRQFRELRQGNVVESDGVLGAMLPAAVASGSHSRDATSLGFATQDISARAGR